MPDGGGSDSGGTGSDSSGGDSTVTASTFVNGDGDIVISFENVADTINGSANIKITCSQNFSDITYNTLDVWEFSSGADAGSKGELTVADNTVSFTDVDASTRSIYRLGIFGESGTRLGQSLFDTFYPTKIEFTVDNKTTSYNIVKSV